MTGSDSSVSQANPKREHAWTIQGQTVRLVANSRGAIVLDIDVPKRREGATLRLSREDAERLLAALRSALDGVA